MSAKLQQRRYLEDRLRSLLSTATYTIKDFLSVGVTFMALAGSMVWIFVRIFDMENKATETTVGSVFYWGMLSLCGVVGSFAVVVVLTCITGFCTRFRKPKPSPAPATPKAEIVFSDGEFKGVKSSKHA